MEKLGKKTAKYSRMGLVATGVNHKRLNVQPKPASQEVVAESTLRGRVKQKLAKFNLDKVLNPELSD